MFWRRGVLDGGTPKKRTSEYLDHFAQLPLDEALLHGPDQFVFAELFGRAASWRGGAEGVEAHCCGGGREQELEDGSERTVGF